MATEPSLPICAGGRVRQFLVIGGAARSIGLYAAEIAVAMGPSYVDYMDHDRKRLEIAEALGANPIQIPKSTAWLGKNAPAKGGSRAKIALQHLHDFGGQRYSALFPGLEGWPERPPQAEPATQLRDEFEDGAVGGDATIIRRAVNDPSGGDYSSGMPAIGLAFEAVHQGI